MAGRPGIDLHYARLAAGDSVFVREEDRQATTPWDDLRYNRDTGRLHWSNDPEAEAHKSKAGTHYTDNSYLSLQVNRNLSSVEVDLSENTFGKFRQALREADEARAKEISESGEEVSTKIEALLVQRLRLQHFDEARLTVERIRSAREPDASTTLKLEARGDAFDLIDKLQEAAVALTQAEDSKSESQLKNSPFSEEQVAYLLRELRLIAEVDTVAEYELFTSENLDGLSDATQVLSAVQNMVDLLVPFSQQTAD